ncbi:SDR family NAD(P)-dependent oxidoreductase [Amycolatopsis sp. NPDC005961]|uniref:SDR family NAD(P)-dependent oxidoreductase n=1 Tax=Amycolatopsis sp. NPDC005961 TaxID=3156720 RepID=UPI0033FC4F20
MAQKGPFPMTSNLAGKTAAVTGATREVGRTVAGKGRRVSTHVADLAVAAQVQWVAGKLRHEDADILINNAATVAPLGPTADLSPADVLDAFTINAVAVVALSAAAIPPMVERGWGRIVNVSSGLAVRPADMIGGTTYVATKAALEAHTINLAAELVGTGVTVNAYRPGVVDTGMQAWIRDQAPEAIGPELHARFMHSYESGRLISEERAAAGLLARLESGTSGQLWTVDGLAA